MRLQMANPKPIPFTSRVRHVSTRWKRSKTRSRWVGGMPRLFLRRHPLLILKTQRERKLPIRVLRFNKALLYRRDGLAHQVGEVHSSQFDFDIVCFQLRHLEEAVNHDRQAIAGLIDGQKEFVPLFARDAALVAEQRGSVAFNGCQGAAQFVAHSRQEFCFEQFHSRSEAHREVTG